MNSNNKLPLMQIFEKENIVGGTKSEIMVVLEKEGVETIDDLIAMTNDIDNWSLRKISKKKL
jgi:hypothetical protein